MAVKSNSDKPPAEKSASTPVDEPAEAPNQAKAESDCVVRADFHVGRAVNGNVCSYHAMHYDAQGNRRK